MNLSKLFKTQNLMILCSETVIFKADSRALLGNKLNLEVRQGIF